VQLAQTYRNDGREVGDVIISTRDIDSSAYVTQSYKSKNKSYRRKADEDNSSEGAKDYFHIKCYVSRVDTSPMFAQAKEQNQKNKEKKGETEKKATVRSQMTSCSLFTKSHYPVISRYLMSTIFYATIRRR